MPNHLKRRLATAAAVCLITAGLVIAISRAKATSAAQMPPLPVVEVVSAEKEDVPVSEEWVGALDGSVNAEIKAQAAGYILKQDYAEGAFVKKNQVLFEIDPRPLKATLDQANGQLAQAEAQLLQAEAQLVKDRADQHRAELDVERYTPLAQQQAVSQQDLDNAIQGNLSAKAQVQASQARVETAKAQIQAAKAAVESARLNLTFTRIASPIDGIAGIAQQQVGALVGPNSGAVTTVSTIDPIKAVFTVSEQEYMAFAQRFSRSGGAPAANQSIPLELALSDGTVYPQKGRFAFADRAVDQNTGTIRLAGLFPNPGNMLRPGQYAKVRAVIGTKKSAVLVPQRSIVELQGGYLVMVVDKDNKIDIRPVKVGRRTGARWIIDEGVKSGEQVVVTGTQKVAPGMRVNPKSFAANAGKAEGE